MLLEKIEIHSNGRIKGYVNGKLYFNHSVPEWNYLTGERQAQILKDLRVIEPKNSIKI